MLRTALQVQNPQGLGLQVLLPDLQRRKIQFAVQAQRGERTLMPDRWWGYGFSAWPGGTPLRRHVPSN